MRKFLFACGMISLMLFTLTACGSEDPAEEISRALHIDVSAGEEISSSDTHGGFHGDGISCVALQFPNSQVADAIAANAAWTPLPLDETAQALAYGVTREDGGEVFSAGPYLTDDSGDPLLPGIAVFLRNGYLTDIPVGERGQKEIQPIRRGRCPHRPAAQMPRDRRGNGSGESPQRTPPTEKHRRQP